MATQAQSTVRSQLKQLSDANPDGVTLGVSGDKISFYGQTPAAQAAKTGTTITTTGVVTGGVFSTSTLTVNFVNVVKNLQALVETLGLTAAS